MRYLRTKNSVGLIMMIALLASVALLRADPGDLDLTFGGDGYVKTDDGVGGFDLGIAMTIDSNNRIIVVGQSVSVPPYTYWGSIVRYNPDGALDTTFGNDGIVLMDLNPFGQLFSVTLDASERILVAGEIDYKGLLARFNSDGTPDLSFGDQGISPAIAIQSASLSLVINQDNSLVIVGYRDNEDDSSDIILAKFTSDGALDLSFGDDGTVVTDLNQTDEAFRVISDDEGRILVVGSSGFTNDDANISKVLVARYLPDGTLDATFGNNGITLTGSDIPGAHHGYSLVIDASNRIVVAGQRNVSITQLEAFLARYNPDGSLDTSFSNDGYLIEDFSSYSHAIDVKLDDAGKIVIAGMSDGDFLVARYMADFSPIATPTATDTPTATNTSDNHEPTATATITTTPTPTETQIESSATASSTPELLEFIENGGFEAEGGTSASWELKRGTDDKVKCDKSGKPPVAYEGFCAFRFKGSVGENSQLFQKPNLGGQIFNVGDLFTLEAYIKAKGQVDFQAQAKFTYADDVKAKLTLDLDTMTDGYTVFADDYGLKAANLVKVKVTLKNKSASGKLDVDAVRLGYTVGAESSVLPLP